MGIKQIAVISMVGMLLTIIGCGGNGTGVKNQQAKTEADSLIRDAYLNNQYGRLEMLADSLRNAGDISDMKSSYWLGYANDKLMRKRLAEFFWNMGIAAFNPEEDQENTEVYAEMASRLAGLKCTLGAYEEALKVARAAVTQLQQMGCDTTSNYTNLIIYIGYCQSRFGLNRSTAAETLEEAYQQHLGFIRKQASSDAYRLAIIGLTNICYNYSDLCDFDNLLFWANRYDSLVTCYDKTGLAAANYTEPLPNSKRHTTARPLTARFLPPTIRCLPRNGRMLRRAGVTWMNSGRSSLQTIPWRISGEYPVDLPEEIRIQPDGWS